MPSGLNISWGIAGDDSFNMGMWPSNVSKHIESVPRPAYPYGTDILLFQNWDGGLCNASNPIKPPLAAQCSLYPCVRTYSTSINSSQMIEQILITEPMLGAEQYPLNLNPDYSLSPMPCLINGTLYNTSTFKKESRTDVIPLWGFGENNQTLHLPSECYFGMGNTIQLFMALGQLFIGRVYVSQLIYDANPAWLGGIYGERGNVTLETFDNVWKSVAEALTVSMRESSDMLNLTALRGQAFRTETCIAVRWPWLVFPFTTLALSIAFLLSTMRHARYHTPGGVIWKDSILAVVFSGLDNDISAEVNGLTEVKDMKRKTENLLVTLNESGSDRLLFRRA